MFTEAYDKFSPSNRRWKECFFKCSNKAIQMYKRKIFRKHCMFLCNSYTPQDLTERNLYKQLTISQILLTSKKSLGLWQLLMSTPKHNIHGNTKHTALLEKSEAIDPSRIIKAKKSMGIFNVNQLSILVALFIRRAENTRQHNVRCLKYSVHPHVSKGRCDFFK